VEGCGSGDGSVTAKDAESVDWIARAGEERGEATRGYIARVMRGFQQDVEAMANPDPPITFWVEKLSKE
jgi:hypothetical protein